MKRIQKAFSFLDHFLINLQVPVFYKKEIKRTTAFGQCMSLMVLISIFIYIVPQIYFLIEPQNPIVSSFNDYDTTQPPVYFSDQNFTFGMGIFIDEKIMDLSNSYFSFELVYLGVPLLKPILFDLAPCNFSYNGASMENFICIKPPFNFSLAELTNEGYTSVVEYEITKCVSGKNQGVKCSDDSENVVNLMQTKQVKSLLFTTNSIFNASNIPNPIATYLNFFEIPMASAGNQMTLVYNKLTVNTDSAYKTQTWVYISLEMVSSLENPEYK